MKLLFNLSKVIFLIPIMFSISGCNSKEEVSDLKIEAEKAIWINYDDNGTSFYDILIDTDGNPNDIKFEYSHDGYIEVSHLRDNAFRVKQLKIENKTITLKAKLGNKEDSIRVHLVYKLEEAGNIISDYLWYYVAPGYTYDMMWRTEERNCGFAVELYDYNYFSNIEIVEQNKIKTLKEGQFFFIARIGDIYNTFVMEVSDNVKYDPNPTEPMPYDPGGVNMPPDGEYGDL